MLCKCSIVYTSVVCHLSYSMNIAKYHQIFQLFGNLLYKNLADVIIGALNADGLWKKCTAQLIFTQW